MDDYLWVLKDRDRDLLRELEPARIAELDEDGLLALHKRVRRARNKHVTSYRRKAADRVVETGARGQAYQKGGKSRMRAEAFEEALAIVSERIAVVAHDHAERLKEERLARARSGGSAGPGTGTGRGGKVAGPGVAREHEQTSGGTKRDASTRATGARRQARKDVRHSG